MLNNVGPRMDRFVVFTVLGTVTEYYFFPWIVDKAYLYMLSIRKIVLQ